MLKEFKAFAFRGNVLDLAVGVILGLAFGAVVTTLVDGVLMPLIAAIFGEPNFDALKVRVGDGVVAYGTFLTALVNFLLVAFAVFLVVRAVNRLMRPRGAAEEAPSLRECPYCRTAIPVSATRCSACTTLSETLDVAARRFASSTRSLGVP